MICRSRRDRLVDSGIWINCVNFFTFYPKTAFLAILNMKFLTLGIDWIPRFSFIHLSRIATKIAAPSCLHLLARGQQGALVNRDVVSCVPCEFFLSAQHTGEVLKLSEVTVFGNLQRHLLGAFVPLISLLRE